MNATRYIIQLLILVIIFGCTDEEWIKQKKGIEVTGSLIQTRTTFTEDNGITHVSWNAGDYISLFSGTQNGIPYRAQSAGNEVTFKEVEEKLVAAENEKIYACYPRYDDLGNPQEIILQSLSYQNNGWASYNRNDVLYASGIAKEGKVSLQFKHLFAFLKITIPIESISNKEEGEWLYIHSSENIAFEQTDTGDTFINNNFFNIEKEELTLNNPTKKINYWINYNEIDKSQKEATCYIAILPQTENAIIEIIYNSGDNVKNITKKVPANGFKAGNVYTLSLNDAELNDIGAQEREALIAFYKATNGDNWNNNTNWCSDKPLKEWYGVYINETGCVTELWLQNNNLTGSLPTELGDLTHLEVICLSYNNLEGELPATLTTLSHLRNMQLSGNKLSGNLPTEIGNLANLEFLLLDANCFVGNFPASICSLEKLRILRLSNNNLSGELPPEIANLWNTNIIAFNVKENCFSGKLPDVVTAHPKWKDFWSAMIIQSGKGFDLEGVRFPASEISVVDIDNNTICLKEEYAKNKFTLLYQWATWCVYSASLNEQLIQIYELYKEKGLEIIGWCGLNSFWGKPSSDLDMLKEYIVGKNIPWRIVPAQNESPYLIPALITGVVPEVFIVDENGTIVFESITQNYGSAITYLVQQLGEAEFYTSTDYSRDGEAITLQKATVGKGIDLVFMGEAFVDKDMETGGKYEQKMKEAMEQYFSIEPYKAFRNRFNVYAVKVVSPNAEFIEGAQHRINEDDEVCFEYASKVPGINTDKLQVSVVYNTSAYAGRSYTRMYPDGTFVGYMMEGVNNVLNHEVGGHGFAKLLDEYVEGGYENLTLPDEMKENLDLLWEDLAWGANVDWRNDRTTVKWSRFLNDSRYANEGLGLYEGSYLYGYGAYRPTENSMMRYNDSPFNAPSREQIYKCIMQQSEGESWTYDYEKFVEYDAINRNATVTRALQTKPSEAARKEWQQRHRPPVFVKGTWRDAMKKQQRNTVVPLR